VGVPAEIVLVRMCSDLNRPKEQRYAYRNALAGLGRIAKDEGVSVLFRGTTPNVTRSVVMNVGYV
jgi:dicarboxylate transporter 10